MKSVLIIVGSLILIISMLICYLNCNCTATGRLDDFDDTISKGYLYLAKSREIDGYWKDYKFTSNLDESDVWVTSVVIMSLKKLEHIKRSRETSLLHQKAIWWIKSRKKKEGWSYNSKLQVDADTSSWCVRAGALTNQNIKLNLSKFQRSSGGISSWYETHSGSWQKEHLDVTANAILAFLEEQDSITGFDCDAALKYLINRQGFDGSWPAFWWNSSLYTTSFAIVILCQTSEHNEEPLKKAIEYVIDKQGDDGGWGQNHSNAIDTSLCVWSLLAVQHKYRKGNYLLNIQRGVTWLIDNQQSDGSWPATELLVIPYEYSSDKKIALVKDNNSIMSTAFALFSLCDYCEYISLKEN